MPSKFHKSDIFEEDERIAAVALLDIDKCSSLKPLTLNSHRLFLPLPSKQIIDASLQYLLCQPILSELILVCREKTRRLLFDYFEESAYKNYLYSPEKPKGTFVIKIVVSGSETLGDALRELDNLSLFHSKKPILLLRSGLDTFGRLDMKRALDEFIRIRETRKNAIMMSLYRPKGREVIDYLLLCDQNRILEMVTVDNLSRKPYGIPLALETLPSHCTLSYNLVPLGVDFITLDVLALYTENFDYQTMDDFMAGILQSDILSYEFYKMETKEMICVTNSEEYRKACFGLLTRKYYPFVYSEDAVCTKGGYLEARGSTYDVKSLGTLFLGRGCQFGRDCQLENCIILDEVDLGDNVRVSNCIIHSFSRIGKGSSLRDCVIGSYCELGSHTDLAKALLGPSTILPDEFKSTEYLRLMPAPKTETKDMLTIPTKVGSKLSMYHEGRREDTDDDDQDLDMSTLVLEETLTNPIGAEHFLFPTVVKYTPQLDCEDDEEAQRLLFEDQFLSGESHPTVQSPSSIHSPLPPLSSTKEHFMTEARETMDQALKQIDELSDSEQFVENTSLEMNALKFACNMSLHDVREAVIPALIHSALYKSKNKPSALGSRTQSTFSEWSFLLSKFTPLEDQPLLLNQIYCHTLSMPEISKAQHILRYSLVSLVSEDVLDPDTVILWYEQEHGSELMGSLSPFIRYLQEDQ